MKKVQCVLLVDDDPVAIFLNKGLLKKLEITDIIDTASNGEDALKRLLKYNAHDPSCPELILLDINMPIMDGFEFMNSFNHLNIKDKNHIKIVVLSSSDSANDMEKMKNLGITTFLNKPLKKEAVLEVLNTF